MDFQVFVTGKTTMKNGSHAIILSRPSRPRSYHLLPWGEEAEDGKDLVEMAAKVRSITNHTYVHATIVQTMNTELLSATTMKKKKGMSINKYINPSLAGFTALLNLHLVHTPVIATETLFEL
ncbi:1752_t:CDS:2 [Acaulospora morrowiae]|uniref:1752_t:CDS:1 n=1 Tax=Acaulospora morrowiae TaxID=94023 RepID=A0A9N8WRL4_9GLOM|nr:1752_t:CDS:2 [Acaulospora morrowiae]